MKPTRDSRRSAIHIVERFLWLGLVAACLPTLLLAARNGLAPTQRPLTFGLVFGLMFAAAYVAAALLAALLALGVSRLPVLRSFPRLVPLGAAVVVAFLATARNIPAARSLFGLAGPSRFVVLTPVAFVTALLCLLVLAILPLAWRARARLSGLVPVVLTATALWPAAVSRTVDDSPPPAIRMATPPLLLIGLDGADWDWVNPLIARGDLPNLAALQARGVWGRLSTLKPTLSPILWTSIATGRLPKHHGIHGFAVDALAGVGSPVPPLKPIRTLGFSELLGLLHRSRLIDSVPVSSGLRRVPAYWNLATEAGMPVDVVDWWATWPAEPVLGAMVSERVYYRPEAGTALDPERRLTYPPALLSELAPLFMSREEVTLEDAQRFMEVTATEFEAMRRLPRRERSLAAQFTYFYSLSETDRRVALHLMREGRKRYGRAPDLLVLFRLLDMVCHTSLAYSELVDEDEHLGASAEDLRRYGRTVTEAHRFADRAVGQLIEAVGEEANIVIVSDHGFDLISRWPDWKQSYDHSQGAEGLFLAAGPAFRPGKVEGLSILDVLPLLVELKGLPLADDLDGREASVSLGERFVPHGPVRRVRTYGERVPAGAGLATSGAEREQMDRLRALGYID